MYVHRCYWSMSTRNIDSSSMTGRAVNLVHCGWGVTDKLCSSLAQFVEVVEDIQLRAYGAGTDQKKRSEWVFEFLQVLRESMGDDVDDKIKFMPYKMVSMPTCLFPD